MSHIEQLNKLFWHEFASFYRTIWTLSIPYIQQQVTHSVWHCLFGTGPSYFGLAHEMHQLSVDPTYPCEKVKGAVTGSPCQISGKEQGSPHWQMENGALLRLCFGCLVHAHGEAAESLKQHKPQLCQHNIGPSVQHSNSAVPGEHSDHKNNLCKALALNHTKQAHAQKYKASSLESFIWNLWCMNEAGCWTQASHSWINTQAITPLNLVLPSTSQFNVEKMFQSKIDSW